MPRDREQGTRDKGPVTRDQGKGAGPRDCDQGPGPRDQGGGPGTVGPSFVQDCPIKNEQQLNGALAKHLEGLGLHWMGLAT